MRYFIYILVICFVISCGGKNSYNNSGAVGYAPPRQANDNQMLAANAPVEDANKPKADFNTEDYAKINDNPFLNVKDEPLSTFSIDVDTASYSNVRRILKSNSFPPPDAVRIEELVNYFTYDYPQPLGAEPFSRTLEVVECPWNKENWLVHIGVQGKRMAQEEIPPCNLVFLLDVSGSMNSSNKLPLLKTALGMLVNEMREQDHISIVVYASASGLVLPSTAGNEKGKILSSLSQLSAGGSTNGGQGIELAYKVAKENFIDDGINRVILATDGDFNVGTTSDGALVRLIEEKRKDGVFLTVLGLGMGNYKDSKMEQLADHGNGNYAYIDTLSEARKVLVNEIGSTLVTIAKDVKIQVEFNPQHIASYRLIGYENRLLRARDFNDDTKDAGEIGAGHSVTALYELVPATQKSLGGKVERLKYQNVSPTDIAKSEEILTLKMRYKHPKQETSMLLTRTLDLPVIAFNKTSENLRFSAAVAAFGMLMRNSPYRGTATMEMVKELANSAKGRDAYGYRSEFLSLVDIANTLEKMDR